MYNELLLVWFSGYSNLQLSVENTPGCIGFAFLSSVIGPKELAPLSQPIMCKTKANHDLVTRVFPRFGPFTVYFEFSSVLAVIFPSSDWVL